MTRYRNGCLASLMRPGRRKFVVFGVLIFMCLVFTFMMGNWSEVFSHTNDDSVSGNDANLVQPAIHKLGHIESKISQKLNEFLDKSQRHLQDAIKTLHRAANPSSLLFHEHFPGLKDNGTNLFWIHDSDFSNPNITGKIVKPVMMDINTLMRADGNLTYDKLDPIINVGHHGIHLHVTSLAQARMAVLELASRPTKPNAPVLLSAPILTGPNSDRCLEKKTCSTPVVLDSIIKLLEEKHFKCTLGLSWTTDYDPKVFNHGYTWQMVYDMLFVVKDTHVKDYHNIAFNVRATLVKNSLPQLRWLMDATGCGLILEADQNEAKLDFLANDIALIYQILPKQNVFLRVPVSLRIKVLDLFPKVSIPEEWLDLYQNTSFRGSDWQVKNDLSDGRYFALGNQSVLMYPGGPHSVYLESKEIYNLIPRVPLKIRGRVQFFEDPGILKAGLFQAGLKISIDSDFAQLEKSSTIVLIGSNGYFAINSHSTKRELVVSDNTLSEVNPCYSFLIEAETRGVDVTLSAPIDCNFPTLVKLKDVTLKIRLDITLNSNPFNIYIRPLGKNDPIIIDQLRVV